MRKGKIINFEILWDSNEPLEVVAPKVLSKDIISAANEGYNTILGIMLNEGLLPYDNSSGNKVFEQLKTLADRLGIEIILVSSVGDKFKHINVPFEIIDFNYHARLVYNAYKDKNKEKCASTKFLFLGGCPTRPNRLGLLSKFYDKNMLDKIEWSFFPPVYQEDKNWCRNYLSRYTDSEYMTFLNKTNKKFDNVYSAITSLIHDSDQVHGNDWLNVKHMDFFKSPGYIHESVFNNTCFSIVSEGPNFWTTDYKFITLITWRTIINKHPFIFAGHFEQFDYIKSLGFKTFEEYMLIPDYAYIDNEEERLDAIVKNAKNLIDSFDSKIYNDAEYNYNRYLEIILEQDKLFDFFEYTLGIDNAEINYYLNQIGIAHLVRDPDV